MITWFTALIGRIGWRRLATWAAAAVAVLALEAVLHDPFGWRKAKVARLERAAASAEADAKARSLEVAAERQSAAKVSQVTRSAARTQAATQVLIRQADAAPDAAQILDPARLARLRAHDAAICSEVPLTGCQGANP